MGYKPWPASAFMVRVPSVSAPNGIVAVVPLACTSAGQLSPSAPDRLYDPVSPYLGRAITGGIRVVPWQAESSISARNLVVHRRPTSSALSNRLKHLFVVHIVNSKRTYQFRTKHFLVSACSNSFRQLESPAPVDRFLLGSYEFVLARCCTPGLRVESMRSDGFQEGRFVFPMVATTSSVMPQVLFFKAAYLHRFLVCHLVWRGVCCSEPPRCRNWR
jgi:hypothetical protein